MAYDFLYDVQDGVATITLNRPEVLNALTFTVYAQLRDLFEALRYDDAVKVVVLTGAGEGFCSGGDVEEIIGELLKHDMKGHIEFTRMTGAVVQHMRLLEKPIIAALNGTTAGAGAVLALASDLRVASERVRFAFLFSRVGLTGADMGAGLSAAACRRAGPRLRTAAARRHDRRGDCRTLWAGQPRRPARGLAPKDL